jgi:putative addiction module component (TIGR02574 family)
LSAPILIGRKLDLQGIAEIGHLELAVAGDEQVRRLEVAVHHFGIRVRVIERGALSLPADQRHQLAKLLLDSLNLDGPSDDELRARLRTRFDDLRTGKDPGMSFEEVFGEKE